MYMGVSIQINRTDTNLVLINVKTILPTLLSVDLYPNVTGLRVPIAAYEKVNIIIKSKITETDSGVGISTKTYQGGRYCVNIINLTSHGISVYVGLRYVSSYYPDIIQARFN